MPPDEGAFHRMMPFAEDEEMLTLEDAADRFGVDVGTVVDWCHKGHLPAMRIGGSWRVRRTALELFLEGLQRPNTLVGQLYAFMRVPDNLLAVTQTTNLSNQLDADFFKVGEARGGFLVKYHSDGPGRPSLDELRAELERRELEVARLEKDGRLAHASSERSDQRAGGPAKAAPRGARRGGAHGVGRLQLGRKCRRRSGPEAPGGDLRVRPSQTCCGQDQRSGGLT